MTMMAGVGGTICSRAFLFEAHPSPGPRFCSADAGFVRQSITLYFSSTCDLPVVRAPFSFQ